MESHVASLSNFIKNNKENLFVNFIEGYNWTNTDKDAVFLRQGIGLVDNVKNQAFVVFANLGLHGEHLRKSIENLDVLLSYTEIEFVADEENKYKRQLQLYYNDFLKALRSAVLLTKYFCNLTSELYKAREKENETFNFIEFRNSYGPVNRWINALDDIFSICVFEHRFSYNLSEIKELLLCKRNLKDFISTSTSKDVEDVVNQVILKIDVLLLKLSHFAKNKRIEYSFNFEKDIVFSQDVSIQFGDKYDKYLKFIDPEHYITREDVYSWQNHKGKKWAKMGDMVLLMLYYTKVKKNIKQAENLLAEYESFYDEMKDIMHLDFNLYALRSVRVYMHNCLLSLKCKEKKSYAFETLVNDMDQILKVQEECYIFNYHPYKKAIEYTIKLAKKDICSRVNRDEFQAKVNQLKMWNEIYKENIKWCIENQRYAFQLTFRECIEYNKQSRKKIFYPSSFSRPLKFDEIQEEYEVLKGEILRLQYDLDRYDDVTALRLAQEKVANMEKSNMKMMGLFISLTTFLIGLLSIFIGNNSSVSIVEKMRYVIVLGTVLLLFVCLGYVLIESKFSKFKSIILGVLGLFLSITLVSYYYFEVKDLILQDKSSKEIKTTAGSVKSDGGKKEKTDI